MKTFIEDLRQELMKRNVEISDIEDIIADHQEMIQTALEEGLSEEEMKKRFGDPSKLADDLSDFSKHQTEPRNIPKEYQVWQTFPFTEKPISINIALVSENVVIQTHEKDNNIIHYAGKGSIEKYEVTFENSELSLKAPKDIGLFFMRRVNNEISFIIEVPFKQKIERIFSNTVSGDIGCFGLITSHFTLNTTSGDVEIKNGLFGQTKWNTVSGDLHVSDTKMVTLISSQVSGDVFFRNIKIQDSLRLNTVSGDAKIENSSCHECLLHSVSGDIRATEFYPEVITLKSVSGDISIKNKEPNKIVIQSKSSVSGDITIDS